SYATSPITPNLYAELQLLLLTFSIGIQDATTFPDYQCFTSNQTGNTIMLIVVGITSSPDLAIASNIGTSLALFLTGAFLTGQLGVHIFGPRTRAWLFAINLLQTSMVFAAAVLQLEDNPSSTQPPNPNITLAVIALLAFSAGSQVVMSRALRITEISTAMATAAWVDLLVDGRIWNRENRARNRRVGFLGCLVAG
ncbi:hypothetical protein BO94DRAFT_423363, partial [Aspergillus sclerotioniger CBS 115572]